MRAARIPGTLAGVLVLACAASLNATAQPANDADAKMFLGPDASALIRNLLAPHAQGVPLPGGWALAGIGIQPRQALCRFTGPSGSLSLRLLPPRIGARQASTNFSLEFESSEGVPDPEFVAARDYLASLVVEHDRGASPWVLPRESPDPGAGGTAVAPPAAAFGWITICQACILLGLGLLAIRPRWLLGRIRRVSAQEWAALALVTTLAAILRLVGGTRIPGYINNHGYGILNELLGNNMPNPDRYYGIGMAALHGLALSVLPRTETTLLAVQYLASVLTVPATWAATRLWVGKPAAIWAALAAAVFSGPVYYALTEFAQVPGALFVWMSVALLGLAARERDSIALFASAILGGIACQFHPVLNVFPALLFLFALSTPQGRGLLRWRPTWLAALVLAALWAFPAQRALSHLAAGETPAHSVSAQLLQFEALVQVNQGFDHSGNTFLNPAFTPPTFALLAAIGLFAALRSRPRRWAVGVAALGAILLTLPGLQGIRMNALRQSVAAHGFLALPVGLGIATLLSLLPDSRAWRRAGGLGGASLVALSMAIWPGPLGQLFTPQHERNFIAGSIGLVPEPCTIYHPSFELGTSQEQPEYLSDPGGKRRAWKPILDSGESMRAASGCAVYFRSAACWDAETGDPAHHPEPLPGHLRPECQRIEAGTDLVPLAVTSIPARPDCEQHFLQDSVEVGLFLVRRPNPVEPAGRAGP